MRHFSPPIRRRALLGGAGALAGLAVAPGLAQAAALPGLHVAAAAKGRFYGAALHPDTLAHDPQAMAHVPIECGMLGSQLAFKWAPLQPEPNRFDWKQADQLLAYARTQHMPVRGHTLVWYQANPDWLVKGLTKANAARILTQHIQTVVGHFRGQLVQWDVVNEALWPADGQPYGLRDSLWLRTLGPGYIDLAFHLCAAADPSALRCLNDYGFDAGREAPRKRDAMLTLLSSLLSRGVPVQAVGMQGHLDPGAGPIDQKALAAFCAAIAAMGLKIVITEMDVRDNSLPAAIIPRDAGVAAYGRAYLDVVLESQATLGVLTWGLSDRLTWLDWQIPRADHLPQRPLPLDTEMRRKPLWYAMREAFLAAKMHI